MHMDRHATVTEDDFFSGFRAVFLSWSQKYPREGQGGKDLDGDWRPTMSGSSGHLRWEGVRGKQQ